MWVAGVFASVGDSIEPERVQRFGAGVAEGLELSLKALFLDPKVGPNVSLNAKHALYQRGHRA